MALPRECPRRLSPALAATPHGNSLIHLSSVLAFADLPPMATKPLRFKALRAALTASPHFLRAEFAKAFLACAERDLDTILPLLFLMRLALVIPVAVFALLPLKTAALPM